MDDMHERLTDVLVEFVPGDREMAGRMAGAVIQAGFVEQGREGES